MNEYAMIVFLRFIQRVQLFVANENKHGRIKTPHDVQRIAEVTYQLSFDRHGNLLVDR